MPLKGVEYIGEAGLRVVLTSSPQIDNGGIKVGIMSGESLLESKEERRRRKEEVCLEDTGVKEIPF